MSKQLSTIDQISEHVTAVEQRLKSGLESAGDLAVLFVGNWHDAMPRQLILDRQIAPVDKVLWQVLRLSIANPAMPGALPSRDQLAQLVGCHYTSIALSRRSLRLSRWLTYCKSVRNAAGQFLSDIYLLNDEPRSISSTLEIDRGYIEFVESEASRQSRISSTASHCLDLLRHNIKNDDDLITPSETEIVTARLQRRGNLVVQDSAGKNHVENSYTASFETQEFQNLTQFEPHVENSYMDDEVKNFSTPICSSSCSSSSSNNNITSREEVSFSDDYMSVLKRYLPEISSPEIEKYTSQLFLIKPKYIPVIHRIVSDSPYRREILFQLVGRTAAAHHGWAKPLRNIIGFIKTLTDKGNEFHPDDNALEVMRAVEEREEPDFYDSPDMIERRRRLEEAYITSVGTAHKKVEQS